MLQYYIVRSVSYLDVLENFEKNWMSVYLCTNCIYMYTYLTLVLPSCIHIETMVFHYVIYIYLMDTKRILYMIGLLSARIVCVAQM